jgi:hypothetical protein
MGMANKPSELWDQNAITRARRVYRTGATLDEVMIAIGTKMSPCTVRARLRAYGMTFGSKPSQHLGTGALFQKPLQRL